MEEKFRKNTSSLPFFLPEFLDDCQAEAVGFHESETWVAGSPSQVYLLTRLATLVLGKGSSWKLDECRRVHVMVIQKEFFCLHCPLLNPVSETGLCCVAACRPKQGR